jgi:heme exporter protein D
MIGAPEITLVLSVVFWLSVAIYLLSLVGRFVRAVERIAAALDGRKTIRPAATES